jgi:hypothetical protein
MACAKLCLSLGVYSMSNLKRTAANNYNLTIPGDSWVWYGYFYFGCNHKAGPG